MDTVGKFHRGVICYFTLMALVMIMLYSETFEGLCLASVLMLGGLFWILLRMYAIMDDVREIEEIKQMIRDQNELYRDGYITREECEKRCAQLRQERWKI